MIGQSSCMDNSRLGSARMQVQSVHKCVAFTWLGMHRQNRWLGNRRLRGLTHTLQHSHNGQHTLTKRTSIHHSGLEYEPMEVSTNKHLCIRVLKKQNQLFHSGTSATHTNPKDSLDYTPQQMGEKTKTNMDRRQAGHKGKETNKHKEEQAKRPQSLQEKLWVLAVCDSMKIVEVPEEGSRCFFYSTEGNRGK